MTSAAAAPYVMVSFSSRDASKVDELLAELDAHKVSHFEYRRNIRLGQDILDTVRDAIERSTHVVIYLSPASLEAPWVWLEVGMGFARDKRLVFVLDEALGPLPLPFDGLRHITGRGEYARFVRELASTATSLMPDFPAGSVEEAARDKLYYYPGGWVRAIRLWGAEDVHFSEDRVRVEFDNAPMKTPPELAQAKERAIEDRKQRAQETGQVFFDGPNVRLRSFRASPVDETSALEVPTLTLQLGPVGWYDYEGLNEAFREENGDSPPLGVYDHYLKLDALIRDGDVSGSRLSNIMDNAVTIVTEDGHLLYGRRTRRVTYPDSLTCAVAENTNRYLDDTDPRTGLLINPHSAAVDGLPGNALNGSYVPKGVPSPFAAVRRGLASEVSPRIEALCPPSAVKVTGLSFGLEILHPDLLFCVFVAASRDEILAMRAQEPGSEAYEQVLMSMPADRDDPETAAILGSGEWAQGGKASVVRALELVHAVRRRHRGSFDEAFRVLHDA
ncbi:toll/interleukin-1 receptor domain-containing protein [Streptomyces sp. NPDC055189]